MLIMKLASVISRIGRVTALGLLLVWGGLAQQAFAQPDALYTARALVKTQSESERKRAASQTLGEIAVRVSGRSDAADNPIIQNAQANAENYLFGFSYSDFTKRIVEDETEIPAMEITLGYSTEAINQLLKNADLPVWPRPRPNVLVWVVMKTAEGLVVQPDPLLVQSLQAVAAHRGVPLVVATQDIEDQLSIRPEDLWRVDRRVIEMASLRYKADAVVLLRMTPVSLGVIPPPAVEDEFSEQSSSEASSASSEPVEITMEAASDSDASSSEAEVVAEPWVMEWQLIHSVIESVGGERADDFSQVADHSVNHVADALAKHYSMGPNADGPKAYFLKINGIKDFRSFKQAQDYLSSLAVIKSLSVVKNDANSLLVKIATEGDVNLLLSTLSLGDQLQLMSDVNALLHGAPSSEASTASDSMSEEELARALEMEFEQSLMGETVESVQPEQIVSPLGAEDNPLVYVWLR